MTVPPAADLNGPAPGTVDYAAWNALATAGKGPLLVDLRMHPDDLDALKASRAAHGGRMTWDGSNPDTGGLRYCGFRVLPDRSCTPGAPRVVCKPE